MKSALAIILLSVAAVLAAGSSAHANNETQLKLQIAPIECSIDELNSGVNTITQVIPSDCIIDGELPVPVSPDGQTPQAEEYIEAIKRRYPEIFLSNTLDSILFAPFATGYDSVSKGSTTPKDDIVALERRTATDTVIATLFIAFLFMSSLALLLYFLTRRISGLSALKPRKRPKV